MHNNYHKDRWVSNIPARNKEIVSDTCRNAHLRSSQGRKIY